MDLPFEQNLDNTGRMIRAGLGVSLLGMALFPPALLRSSKTVTLLASIGTISLVEAAMGYCVGADAVARLNH
jgi:putative Mn2+ efflux pump MntP